jgi:hypothetical protein
MRERRAERDCTCPVFFSICHFDANTHTCHTKFTLTDTEEYGVDDLPTLKDVDVTFSRDDDRIRTITQEYSINN